MSWCSRLWTYNITASFGQSRKVDGLLEILILMICSAMLLLPILSTILTVRFRLSERFSEEEISKAIEVQTLRIGNPESRNEAGPKNLDAETDEADTPLSQTNTLPDAEFIRDFTYKYSVTNIPTLYFLSFITIDFCLGFFAFYPRLNLGLEDVFAPYFLMTMTGGAVAGLIVLVAIRFNFPPVGTLFLAASLIWFVTLLTLINVVSIRDLETHSYWKEASAVVFPFMLVASTVMLSIVIHRPTFGVPIDDIQRCLLDLIIGFVLYFLLIPYLKGQHMRLQALPKK